MVFIVTEDGGEDGVHRDGDGQGQQHLLHGEGTSHQFCGMRHAQVAGKGGHAGGEDHEGHVDAHAEDAPHHGARQYAEAGLQVAARADAQAQQLAQGGEDAELQEAHHHAVRGVERLITPVECVTQEEREEQGHHNQQKNKVFLFHGCTCIKWLIINGQ